MNEKPKKTVRRSPNFPSMNLEDAIALAKKIYDADGRAGSMRTTVLKHLGYKGEHGISRMTISALKKFSLIEESDNNIRLTRQAEVIFISKDETRVKQAKQECALSPIIYKKLWEQYSDTGFPSDATLRDKLIWEFDFNEKAVDGFLEDFRSTLDYVDLKPGKKTFIDNTEENLDEVQDEPELMSNEVSAKRTPTEKLKQKIENQMIKEYLIPRKGDKLAMPKLEKPVFNEDIDLIVKWLELLRSTIVDKEETGNE